MVCGVDDDTDTFRLKNVENGMSYLRCHLFLNLEPLGIDFEYSCELANAHDAFIGEIADVAFSDNGSHMMFAVTFEPDVS